MSTERAPGRWEKRPPRVLGIPGMTQISLDTTTIHDFRARNGWYATMTRHGSGRRAQYEARIHDAQGRDVRGMWIHTNLMNANPTQSSPWRNESSSSAGNDNMEQTKMQENEQNERSNPTR